MGADLPCLSLATRAIITDPLYKSFPSLAEKKAVFTKVRHISSGLAQDNIHN